eukprot:10673261-Lingulodinium_polyedra.AAC.1
MPSVRSSWTLHRSFRRAVAPIFQGLVRGGRWEAGCNIVGRRSRFGHLENGLRVLRRGSKVR